MLLIAMAGLPGTGKSTLAAALARALGAQILDKDRVRTELFAAEAIDYSEAQDDRVMAELFERVRRAPRDSTLIIDGRTHSRRSQVQSFERLVGELAAQSLIIECVCEAEVACQRLARDRNEGRHPAANRGPELYRRVAARAEPIESRKLVVDTDRESLEAQVARCRAALVPTLRSESQRGARE